jgi:hypothetical protein
MTKCSAFRHPEGPGGFAPRLCCVHATGPSPLASSLRLPSGQPRMRSMRKFQRNVGLIGPVVGDGAKPAALKGLAKYQNSVLRVNFQ